MISAAAAQPVNILTAWQVLIPVVVVFISSIVGPLYLSRRKTTGDLGVGVLEEGRKMREDLWKRIESLEGRLETATTSMGEVLETNRELRTEIDRCTDQIN